MNVQLPGVSLPEGATVTVRVEVTAQVNVTAYVARQKASRFVVMEISSQMGGEAPDLHIGERLCWSVPIVLTFPDRGVVGRVGEVLVDATTGEVLADAECVRRISENGQRLADRAAL